MVEFTLAELATLVNATVVGDADIRITGLAALASAGPADLTHLSSPRYLGQLSSTRAAAVLLTQAHASACPTSALICSNPYWAFARLSQKFEQPTQLPAGIASGATVEPGAVLGVGVALGSGSVVGAGAVLGAGCRVHPNVVIGAGCELGDGVELHPGVVLAERVRVGAHSSIHANAVIGAEGFGYAPDARGHLERIAQLGSVVLGIGVSVGANSTIDRGALGDTCIGDGVKIDNQVQIGHNCQIGDHSVICGCCGIVGSTTIGKHCVLGGGVGVGGDGPLRLCDGVTISGMTHVSRSIDQPGVYSGGVLHAPATQWKRNAIRFGQLDKLAQRMRRLEAEVETLRSDRAQLQLTQHDEQQPE